MFSDIFSSSKCKLYMIFAEIMCEINNYNNFSASEKEEYKDRYERILEIKDQIMHSYFPPFEGASNDVYHCIISFMHEESNERKLVFKTTYKEIEYKTTITPSFIYQFDLEVEPKNEKIAAMFDSLLSNDGISFAHALSDSYRMRPGKRTFPNW